MRVSLTVGFSRLFQWFYQNLHAISLTNDNWNLLSQVAIRERFEFCECESRSGLQVRPTISRWRSCPQPTSCFDELCFFLLVESQVVGVLIREIGLFPDGINRGTSSFGRALALHARGAGIETLVLHIFFLFSFVMLFLSSKLEWTLPWFLMLW